MAKLPENKERRLQGLNQDVLAVQEVPLEPADSEPVPLRRNHRRQQPVSVSESGKSGTVWLALGIAILALLLAIWQWMNSQQLSQELGKLKADYYQLASRVSEDAGRQERERPVAASAPTDNGALVNLRDDLRELSSRVRALSVSVAKMGKDDGEAAKLEKRIAETEAGLRSLSSRVASLANRPAPTAAPAPAPAQAAPDPRVDALQTKVTKIDKDLQALYRILQGG